MTEKKPETTKQDLVKRALNRLVKTQDGKVFINWLMDICGFATSSIVVDVHTGEICLNSSIYNEARKTIYYKVRSLIKAEDLKEIEHMRIKENADNEI